MADQKSTLETSAVSESRKPSRGRIRYGVKKDGSEGIVTSRNVTSNIEIDEARIRDVVMAKGYKTQTDPLFRKRFTRK
ncbi:hypothetical protein CR205_16760 [Alteribacter lacisalsi]|uniref:Uncharacterized protein n=1 Tax=Alteribacter lacisalsi TaxID=2045244 RepID=A0A2W0HGK2_9BACI|nr:hypothetical protein [Alteribacter lacisalsi]PYZ96022.1 hypothetical protein CR205_16760 [Alteribacter lacisalsi]